MNGISEQDRAVRARAKGFAAAVLTIFLTGMIALGTPPDAEETAPAPMARAELPASPAVSYPAIEHPHPLDGTPWQWDPAQ